MNELIKEMDIAEQKAWDALARYKFQMFGYWAAIWVHLNRISKARRPNPWTELVKQARDVKQLQKSIPLQPGVEADVELISEGVILKITNHNPEDVELPGILIVD